MAQESNGATRLLVTVLLAVATFLAGTSLALYSRGDADTVKKDLRHEIDQLDERYYRTLQEINERLRRLEDRRDQAGR